MLMCIVLSRARLLLSFFFYYTRAPSLFRSFNPIEKIVYFGARENVCVLGTFITPLQGHPPTNCLRITLMLCSVEVQLNERERKID